MDILVVSTITLAAGLVVTYWLHSQYAMDVVVSPVDGWKDGDQYPLISVIIPARNEARNIRRCVEALLGQTYPNDEIIVVDDRSTDATLQILEDIQSSLQDDRTVASRFLIVHGDELRADWAGKPHALVQGASAARGEWFCFVDADTFAAPELLISALYCAQRNHADLFTILTEQELGSFWEKVILPLVFTALSAGFPARRVNDPNLPDAIANGQFILIRKDVYQAIGGHYAVKDRIDEDKGLAEAVKQAGYRLLVADGRAVARTRMYTSFTEIWEGWTKNIFLGMQDRLGLLTFGGFVGLIGAILLPIWLLGGIYWFILSGEEIPAVVALEALILWAYLLVVRARASIAFQISPLYALTLPLGALVFTAMMLTSTFKVISRQGVTWRGRTYRT
ncbi:MAG: glycosyltransferase [Omnitrophica WOR_2 bacterium]